MGWRRMCRVGVLVVTIMALRAYGAAAQDTAVRVTGTVLDVETGAPVDGAQIQILERGLRVLSSEDGRFVFTAVPPGIWTLRIDRLGYRVSSGSH